jgi:hypothetical protein
MRVPQTSFPNNPHDPVHAHRTSGYFAAHTFKDVCVLGYTNHLSLAGNNTRQWGVGAGSFDFNRTRLAECVYLLARACVCVCVYFIDYTLFTNLKQITRTRNVQTY